MDDDLTNAQALASGLIRLIKDIANGTNEEDIRSDLREASEDLEQLSDIARNITY